MSNEKKITRRAMLQVGLGAAAGIATGTLLAQTPEEASCGTPAQTEGPFYPRHRQADRDVDLTRIEGRTASAVGEVIYVSGRVLDNHGEPIAGAWVDVWQANHHGRYDHEDDPNPAPLDPNFQGWGQVKTDASGAYRFRTITPGAYPVDDKWSRPPHIHFKVSKRGYHEVTTQMYFEGHALNEKDQLLMALSEPERKKVVVAFHSTDDAPDGRHGQFDLELCRVREG